MKYSFIALHKKTWPVDPMCQLLGVTRNGFYRYQNESRENRDDRENQEMLRLIKEIAAASDYSYGSRRMKKAMHARGYPIGRYKVRKLMREAGIQVRHRKKYKVTTNSDHKQPVFENVLNRQFSVSQPNQAYYLCVDTRGVVISCGSNRLIFQTNCRLEHEFSHEKQPGMRCVKDVSWAKAACSRLNCALRSRFSICKPCLPKTVRKQQFHWQHES
ncbi:HTH-like domain-containing protein [Nitrosomonas sp. Nm58]|nr:HTH-like domain-containing protein [Nitrosomonas sp. Nm58]